MIPWNQTQAPQAPEAKITIGPCYLSVCESSGDPGRQWQWFTLSFGEFSEAPLSECLETWPKRAIQLARQAVRELDRRLQELDE